MSDSDGTDWTKQGSIRDYILFSIVSLCCWWFLGLAPLLASGALAPLLARRASGFKEFKNVKNVWPWSNSTAWRNTNNGDKAPIGWWITTFLFTLCCIVNIVMLVIIARDYPDNKSLFR